MKQILFCILILFASLQAQESPTLTLDLCIDMALAANTDYQKNQLSLKQTHLSVQGAWSSLMPSAGISSSASAGKSEMPGAEWNQSWSASGSVSQSFYQPGLYTNIRLARSNEKAAQLTSAELRSQTVLSVERQYYQILTSMALIEVYKENIVTSEQNLDKIRLMYRVGSKTESDTLKAVVQLGDFIASLYSEQKQLMDLKRDLNVFMGRPPETPFELQKIEVQPAELPSLQSARELVLQRNQNYCQAQQNLHSQELAVTIAREAYLPSLSGSYSYSQSGDFNQAARYGSHQVGLRASLDLFDGFRKRQNVQREKFDLDKLRLDLKDMERSLVRDVDSYYQNLVTLDQLIGVSEQNVHSSRRDLELVTERYANGASTILDQTSAQTALIKAQADLVNLRYSRKMVEAQIKQLLFL